MFWRKKEKSLNNIPYCYPIGATQKEINLINDRYEADKLLAQKRAAEEKERRLNQLEYDLLELIDRPPPIPFMSGLMAWIPDAPVRQNRLKERLLALIAEAKKKPNLK